MRPSCQCLKASLKGHVLLPPRTASAPTCTKIALGRYSRRGSTPTSPPHWASWLVTYSAKERALIFLFSSLYVLEFALCPIYIEGVFDCLLSHWLLSLYDQHGISLAQVKGAEVGDEGPGDGVDLHHQPHPPDPGAVRVHGWWESWLRSGSQLGGSGFFAIEGSNGGLDDGLQILPRLLPTPLNHLQIMKLTKKLTHKMGFSTISFIWDLIPRLACQGRIQRPHVLSGDQAEQN